jgi:hypothetical protein
LFATDVIYTCGKFATSGVDTAGIASQRLQIFPPVVLMLLIPVAICHRHRSHWWQICNRCGVVDTSAVVHLDL